MAGRGREKDFRTLVGVRSVLYTLGMATTPDDSAINYDEARVPRYELPDPLTASDGRHISSVDEWESTRRPELLELFRRHVYGRVPAEAAEITVSAPHTEELDLLDGTARAVQTRLRLSGRRGSLPVDVLTVLPRELAERPVPVVVALNFRGNQTVCDDPGIRVTASWVAPDTGAIDNRATESSRGVRASRWPLDLILGAGYGLVTAYCGDFDPDYDDGFADGVHGLVEAPVARREDSWGTIAGWAWGLSRIVDYLNGRPDVDASRIAVLGHSRLGKAALWAAAQDRRFCAAISNDSGCGGAAITRREYGETIGAITGRFPHWFCRAFSAYAGRADELPVDQHGLLALLAPRPCCVGSAQDDRWADPYGEYLSVFHAGPVYGLYGHHTVPADRMPPVGVRTGDRIAYHCRAGGHDITDEDWRHYLTVLNASQSADN